MGSGAPVEGMALDGSVGSGQALHVAGGKKVCRNGCTVDWKRVQLKTCGSSPRTASIFSGK